VAEDFIEIDSKSIDNQIKNLEKKIEEKTLIKPKDADGKKEKKSKGIVKPKDTSDEHEDKKK
jgi:hypothetical protein